MEKQVQDEMNNDLFKKVPISQLLHDLAIESTKIAFSNETQKKAKNSDMSIQDITYKLFQTYLDSYTGLFEAWKKTLDETR